MYLETRHWFLPVPSSRLPFPFLSFLPKTMTYTLHVSNSDDTHYYQSLKLSASLFTFKPVSSVFAVYFCGCCFGLCCRRSTISHVGSIIVFVSAFVTSIFGGRAHARLLWIRLTICLPRWMTWSTSVR
ncbi:hypothetical protein F4810DRAFT_333340 [Camillea tinctor]|nr:hypothetical protein F4810DRAFT_333340 [Camillea tinctor]